MAIEKWTKETSTIPAWQYIYDIRTEHGHNTKFNYKIKNYHGYEEVFEAVRLFANKEQQAIGKFLKGARSRGIRVSDYNIIEIEPIIKAKSEQSENAKFIKNMEKVEKHLAVDGLWGGIKTTVRMYKHLGLEICQKAYKHSFGGLYHIKSLDEFKKYYAEIEELATLILAKLENAPSDVKEMTKKATDKIHVYDKEHFSYTNLKEFRADLEEYIGKPNYYEILGQFRDMEYLQNPKVKKMCFHKGKWNANMTEWQLNRIAEAMDKKENFRCCGQNGYDVSFEYNAESNRAWYSEEYVGCGNGHYYLALNRTHAIYYEKD